MSEELQPYAIFVYLLVAVSFIVTPWAAILFLQWRRMLERHWMKLIFTVIPIVMILLFLIRIAVLFKIFESVDIQFGRLTFQVGAVAMNIVLSYIGLINGIFMVVMFHLATRSVKRAYDHRRVEVQHEGQKTSEILGHALARGERIHAVMADFLHTRM
jgi:hypothetical protein